MQHFYAYVSRLKLIKRWGLMRNIIPENDMEHSLQVAFIAHGLAILSKIKFGRKDINPEYALSLAAYHDVSEVITGDLPTPIKYKNAEIKNSYKQLEDRACDQLLNMLNEDLKSEYIEYLKPDTSSYEWKLVKAADKLCAYIKCLEEELAGNKEFLNAKSSIYQNLLDMNLPELNYFIENCLPSFALTLDQITKDLEENK